MSEEKQRLQEKFYCGAQITDKTIDQARDCPYYMGRKCINGFGRKDRLCSVLFLAEETAIEKGEKLQQYSRPLPPLTLGQE